jgi:methyl-accepting chemotaxis protein
MKRNSKDKNQEKIILKDKKYIDLKRKLNPAAAFFTTIRMKLILSFLVPILFIIILGIVSFQKAAQGIRSSYENSTSQAINMTGEYLNLGIETVNDLSTQYMSEDSFKNHFTGIYKDDFIEDNNNYNSVFNTVSTKVSVDNIISDISIMSDKVLNVTTTDYKGENFCADFYQTELGKDIKAKPYDVVWIGADEYLDEKLGKDYALRLVRQYSGTGAVIVMDIDVSTVKGILANLNMDEIGTVGLVTKDAVEIISGQEEKDQVIFTDQEFFQKAVADKQTSGAYYVDFNGKKNLFIYKKISDTGAIICSLLPRDIIMSQADSIKKVTLIIIIIACIVAVIIGGMISTGLDKTIKGIILGLKKAAKGDLTITFSSKRKDEFRTLIEEIQNTFANMKLLIKQVNQLSLEVSDSSGNVANTSEAFLKASEDISLAMNEIEQGVNQQAKDAEECLQQMDKLSGKIVVVSENTKEINQIADDTKKSIDDGTVVTKELNSQTKATMEITTEIIKEIEELAEKSMSISKIINVINEIANQTNLLSLNASIEAARAGEYGRGFAVVAEEIRKLAEQSSNSVKDIQKIISNIQDNTKNTVLTARKAESVMLLQETAVENTTISYRRINQNVERLVLNLNDILANVENIEQARCSTLGAIENISAVLEEVAASSNTVNQAAHEQLHTVEALNEAAGSLNTNSDHLVNAVKAFKI